MTSTSSVDLQRWLEARLAALPADAFDTIDDWPENNEPFDNNLPGNFSATLEPATIEIEYRDATGEISQRRITLLQMSGTATSPVYIDARCHKRAARRKFRFDRILSIKGLPDLPPDPTPAEVLSALADLAIDARPSFSPPSSKERPARTRAPVPPAFKALRDKYRAELRLLGFLSQVDGDIHRGEKQAIDRYARGLAEQHGLAWQLADSAALDAYLNRLEFSVETERACIKQLQLWHEDLAARFSLAMSEVMEADGRFDPAEVKMVFGWGLKPENIHMSSAEQPIAVSQPATPTAPTRRPAYAAFGVVSVIVIGIVTLLLFN